jgi:hypothetical protein
MTCGYTTRRRQVAVAVAVCVGSVKFLFAFVGVGIHFTMRRLAMVLCVSWHARAYKLLLSTVTSSAASASGACVALLHQFARVTPIKQAAGCSCVRGVVQLAADEPVPTNSSDYGTFTRAAEVQDCMPDPGEAWSERGDVLCSLVSVLVAYCAWQIMLALKYHSSDSISV